MKHVSYLLLALSVSLSQTALGSQVAVGAAEEPSEMGPISLIPDLDKEVIKAAKQGDHNALVALRKKAANFKATDKKHAAGPLHWAILKKPQDENRSACIFFLLNSTDVNVNAKNKHNVQPITLAASQGDPGTVLQLLKHNALDVSAQQGAELVYHYISRANCGLVNLLLEKGAPVPESSFRLITDLDEQQRNQLTAYTKEAELIDTIRFTSDVEHVVMLIESGVDVNTQYSQGGGIFWTPLLCATAHGRTKIVQTLIEKGAYIPSEQGKRSDLLAKRISLLNSISRPEDIAHTKGHIKLYNLFILYNRLFAAVDGVLTHDIQDLLKQGLYVNVRTSNGKTLLHFATKNLRAHFENVQALVEAGADVNALDGEGKSPLYYAAKRWYDETYNIKITKFLLQNGADKDSVLEYVKAHDPDEFDKIERELNSQDKQKEDE